MSISPSLYVLYLQYLLVALMMAIAFSMVYLRLTPADEMRLIREGNVACALSFGGALLGFCLPLASSIANNIVLLDFVLWGLAAAMVQVGVYFGTARLVRGASQQLERGNHAVGLLFAVVAVAAGLLNAACIVG